MRGQLLVMLALAAYYIVALAIARFDLALPLGVFTGLAISVPYVGFGLGLVLSLLAGLLQFGALKGLVAGGGGVRRRPDARELRADAAPGGRAHRAQSAGGDLCAAGLRHLFGFVGVLIALPASAVMLVALRRAKTAYLSSRLYTG